MDMQEALAKVEEEIAPLVEKGYSVTEAMLLLKEAQDHIHRENAARRYGYESAEALDAHLRTLGDAPLQERAMRNGASVTVT